MSTIIYHSLIIRLLFAYLSPIFRFTLRFDSLILPKINIGVLMTSPVKLLRKSLFMTQAEFAKKVGVSRMMIYAYELGHTLPGNKTIKRLMEIARENNVEIRVEDFFKE